MNEALGATTDPLEQAVQAEVFKSEVLQWSDRIGVEPKEIHMRPMTRKWASCSSNGRLTFDTGLLKQPPDFRTHVIVHELVHLKVPNHGKLFRSLVRAHLSNGLTPATQYPTLRRG
jgi:predicted metal-dependent hydrolase